MKKADLLKMIVELEKRVASLEKAFKCIPIKTPGVYDKWSPSVIFTNGPCINGGQHQFPYIWNGTGPAPCIRCRITIGVNPIMPTLSSKED